MIIKIAITGANGFIGSNLTGFLRQQGYAVTAIIRQDSNCALIPSECHTICVDYSDHDSLKKALENQDIVIHCAAQTKSVNYKEIHDSNVLLTRQIVQICNELQGIRQLVFLSSQAAAGPGKGNLSVKETDNPAPISRYGKSKLSAEKVIRSLCLKPYTIIRPASVFGPGDKDFLFYFQLVERHIAIHPGFNDKYISLIYIADLMELVRLTLLNDKAYNEVFFASDGKFYSITTFCESLALAMNKNIVPLRVPDSIVCLSGFIMEMIGRFQHKIPVLNKQKALELKQCNWLISNKKAVEVLEFSPKSKLINQLSFTYKWYKEKKWI